MLRGSLSAVLVFAAVMATAQGEYEIGAGDVVAVEIAGPNGLTGDFAIEPDGMMFFPYIGRVKASQMTPLELERKLTTLLADGYFKNPVVRVTVKEFRSQKVFVTGEIASPGAHGLRTSGSLLALLTDAGGVTNNAGHEAVVIRPPPEEPVEIAEAMGGGDAAEGHHEIAEPAPTPTPDPVLAALPGWVPGAEVFHVSLRELRSGNPDKDLTLQAGDTVYVPRYAQVYVTGHVRNPGAFRYEEGITVFQAITMAGGLADRASDKARLVRLVDGKRKEERVEMGAVLQPEDTVKVPESFF